jgi:hypothetical protein
MVNIQVKIGKIGLFLRGFTYDLGNRWKVCSAFKGAAKVNTVIHFAVHKPFSIW